MAGNNIQQKKVLKASNLAEWLRNHLSDTQRYLLLWVIAGLLCGGAAVLFHLSIDGLFKFIWTTGESLDPLTMTLFMVGAPTLGGLITGFFLYKIAPSAAGSGIPQTKAAYYQNFGVIRLREAFYRFILGTISVGSGMSLGREGPTVHICSAIASKIGQVFGLAKSKVQAMVPVGMGAGIAAAFNAPISAMFFVFEELLGDFSSKALFGILVAVVIAAALERIILGEHPAFEVQSILFHTDWWMLLCIPISLASVVVGHYFVVSLLQMRKKFRETKRIHPILRPALGGLGVGVLGMTVYHLTGRNGVFAIGYQDLSDTLNGELVLITILLPLLVAKFAATVLAYSSGGSGGLFAPSLFLGAVIGAIVGRLGQLLFGFDDSIIGATALLGMGSFFAAVIRCPMTSIMIIFEMTRNYTLILPLMAGNIIAWLISTKLRPVSLYDSLLLQDKISLRKMPHLQGNQDWRNLPVSTIMTFDVQTVRGDLSCTQNLKELDGRKKHAYPVMDNTGKMVGMITHHELVEKAVTHRLSPVRELLSDKPTVVLFPETSIRDAANTLVLDDVMQAPVVSKTDKSKLLGILTLHDITRQQNAISEKIQ